MRRVLAGVLGVMCAVAAFWAFAGQAVAEDQAGVLQEKLKGAIAANESMNAATKELVLTALLPEFGNKIFVAGIEAQNAKKLTMEKIQEIDKAWMEAEEELPIMKEMTTNAVAEEIKRIAKANPKILEAFVMDNQGANVGQNEITSDYWQGDEAKWQNSFKNGEGGLDVGKVSFDKSANAQIQQVSLPVVNDKGEVIGAVTWGLRVD